MRLPLSKPARVVALTIIVILTIESVAFSCAYLYAFQYLKENDPRKGSSRAEMRVFFRPKLLGLGQKIGLEEVERHLASIGYYRSGDRGKATFSSRENTLTIHPRHREFSSAVISFDRRRITSILVEGHPVERVEVEPHSMVSFWRSMPEDLARRTRVRRLVLQPDDIPQVLFDAICSSEDHRFYTHNGVDELGILSGVIGWLKGADVRGGSTATQQLIKNDVLDDQSRTLTRKGKEFFLALAAERLMTKAEIMAAYSSTCYMGHVPGGPDIHGMAAAALEYFGVENLKELTLAQAATLAGMLDGPANYVRDARNGDYSLLIERRTRVLELMHRNLPDTYSADLVARAKTESIKFLFLSDQETEQPLDMVTMHFQNFAAAQVGHVINSTAKPDNLRVYTTIEPELQTAAHQAIVRHLSKLDQMVITACRRQGVNPASIKPIQAALVAMDAQTGDVIAMVGGRDGQLNFATRKRSPGSAIKPFVYLKAIETGKHKGVPFTAATFIDPANDPVYGSYRPDNNIGKPARARVQLAASSNGAAVVAAHDAGLVKVRDLIYTLTQARVDELNGLLAIGGAAGSEVSLLDLVSGYTVFPAGGQKISPSVFTAVYQNESEQLSIPRAAPLRVTEESSAFVVTQMLRSVLEPGGTSPNTFALAGLEKDTQLAAKSGSGQIADLIFVGFSSRIVVGVWCGMPDNIPALRMEDGFSGARTAMPIWASFMRAVKDHRSDLLQRDFQRPANVRTRRIESKTGCITDGPGLEEYFIDGREPATCKD